MPFEGTCTTAEKIPVTVTPNTGPPNFRPAAVDGALTFEILSGDGTTEYDPANQLVFFAVTGSQPVDTVIKVTGDADMSPNGDGTGVRPISDTYTLHATTEEAQNFGMTSGAAVPK